MARAEERGRDRAVSQGLVGSRRGGTGLLLVGNWESWRAVVRCSHTPLEATAGDRLGGKAW